MNCQGSVCPPTLLSFGSMAGSLISLLLIGSAIVLFIMIIVTGLRYITSGGKKENVDKTAKGLLYSVVGFGLVFLSFIILQLLSSVTGLSSGFSFSNGNFKFNLQSTFTPTYQYEPSSVPGNPNNHL